MNFNNHGVARAVTAAGAAVRLIAVFLIAALIVSPQLAAAQAAPGQPITDHSAGFQHWSRIGFGVEFAGVRNMRSKCSAALRAPSSPPRAHRLWQQRLNTTRP